MITYSDTFPERIRLSGQKIYLVEQDHIQIHKTINEQNIEEIIYEYDEHIIVLEPRYNIIDYVENNFIRLLNYAKENPYVEEVKLSTEEYIKKLEKENKSLSDAVDMLIIDTLGGV